MEQITTVGIDLAKNVFSLHGVDAGGRTVLRRTVRRDRLLETVASLSPCLIGMEACSGAHEWGRRFMAHGHRVKLMAPKFVAAYRKSDKNDGNDAEAVCEAVTRPNMRFVPGRAPSNRRCSRCTVCARASWSRGPRSSIGCAGCFASSAWCCRCAR